MSCRTEISRRRFLLTSAAAGSLLFLNFEEAKAFWGLFLRGLSGVVTLWEGYKMTEDIYNRLYSSDRKAVVDNEVRRVVRAPDIYNYYSFKDSYNISFYDSDPGIVTRSLRNPQHCCLCCGTRNEAVLLPSGFVIALQSLIDVLLVQMNRGDVYHYTRPMANGLRFTPWHYRQRSVVSNMAYFAPEGNVALQWYVPNLHIRRSILTYRLQDRHSKRIVVERRISIPL